MKFRILPFSSKTTAIKTSSTSLFNPVLNKDSECFKSFRNISRDEIRVYKHYKNGNFGSLISAIFRDTGRDTLASPEELSIRKFLICGLDSEFDVKMQC